MGLLIWPRDSLGNMHFLLCLLLLCLTSANTTFAFQIVPDDIAYKPASETIEDTDTTEPEIAEASIVEAPGAEASIESDTSIVETPTTSIENCKTHNQWQKTVTITAMPRLIPGQSNGGNFYHAETYIPRMLATELNQAAGVESRFISHTVSYQLDEEKKRRQVQTIAAQQGTQFVLQGEIIDMSMRDASTVYSPGVVQTLRNYFTDITLMKFSDNRTRVFGLRLELRDGFTGEVLLEDSFHTSGIWKNPNPVGFTSAALWKSDYGRRITHLLRKAGDQIASNLKCQPYMAKIEVNPGQTELLLQGGANNGLHPGDNLKLYQLVVIASPNQYDSYHTRLIKRDLQLELKEVYPSHSLAQLKGDDLLNGQYLAVGE